MKKKKFTIYRWCDYIGNPMQFRKKNPIIIIKSVLQFLFTITYKINAWE